MFGAGEVDMAVQTLWEGKISNTERYSKSYKTNSITSAEKVKIFGVSGGWYGVNGSFASYNENGNVYSTASLNFVGFGGDVKFNLKGVSSGFVGLDTGTGISLGHGGYGAFKVGYEW